MRMTYLVFPVFLGIKFIKQKQYKFGYIYRYVDIHMLEQTYISLLGELSGPRSNTTPVAMSIPITQIVVSNTILQFKRDQSSLKVADSRTRAENIQAESGASYNVRM